MEKMGKNKEGTGSASFTEKDAEDLIKAALGKDVFERPDKENKQKPYVYQEIDRLGKKLAEFSKKARET